MSGPDLAGCVVKEAGAIELIQVVFVALLWLLSSLAIILVALCLPPIHLRARVDSLHFEEETSVNWDEVVLQAQASGLLGALQIRLERRDRNMQGEWRLFGITKSIGGRGGRDRPNVTRRWAGSRHKSKSGPKEKTKKSRRRTLPFNPANLKRLLPEAQWLLSRARRQLNVIVSGALVYGFSDPFATALVHGLIAALPPWPKLEMQPDYAQGRLEGWLELSMRIYPLQVLFLLVRACFRPGVRSLWWPRVRSALWIIPKRIKEVIGT